MARSSSVLTTIVRMSLPPRRTGSGKPPGMRNIHILTPLSSHSIVSADGGPGSPATSRLVALRHGTCSLSTQTHDPRGIGAGICLDLPAFVFRTPQSGGAAPEDWRAIPGYMGMSYLYKRSNRFWHHLIKHDLVHAVWHPLVEMNRRRHIRFRRRLARSDAHIAAPGQIVSAGVTATRKVEQSALHLWLHSARSSLRILRASGLRSGYSAHSPRPAWTPYTIHASRDDPPIPIHESQRTGIKK